MIDLLTIEQGRYDKTLLGTYYPTQQDVGVPFDYEILDPKAVDFDTMQNLSVSQFSTTAIKSNDPFWQDIMNEKKKGFVALQTGGLFEITQIRQDTGKVSIEAYMTQTLPLGTDYVLRLVEVDNPFNLK